MMIIVIIIRIVLISLSAFASRNVRLLFPREIISGETKVLRILHARSTGNHCCSTNESNGDVGTGKG